MDRRTISGFSKLSKRGKIKWIVENFFKDPELVMNELVSYWHTNEDKQKILDGFSENTISNFPLPYSVAPNFYINKRHYAIPMVIEESSVVAAASSAAKYWMSRGGFNAEIIDTRKVGHVHFDWKGDFRKLKSFEKQFEIQVRQDAANLTTNMERRGGGILNVRFVDRTDALANYYQLEMLFETCDSMGANFINSILEVAAGSLEMFLLEQEGFCDEERDFSIIMSILSNYTPQCLVRAEVSCDIKDLGIFPNGMSADVFAKKFHKAIEIAKKDVFRATTHNKGIFNGIDSVVLATGNDFRAIEACGHAYASRSGQYASLTDCSLEDGIFRFWIEIPLALGTVGGLTSLHPMAKRSLELMGNPNAQELMKIIASVGLAQNFSAIRSLVTIGIQKGHMKMHLVNILNHFDANSTEMEKALKYFEKETVSFSGVRQFLENLRGVSVSDK
jgi:hydroxymethylglutaryl-CoA reductase